MDLIILGLLYITQISENFNENDCKTLKKWLNNSTGRIEEQADYTGPLLYFI